MPHTGGWPDDIKATVNHPYPWPMASSNFIALYGGHTVVVMVAVTVDLSSIGFLMY